MSSPRPSPRAVPPTRKNGTSAPNRAGEPAEGRQIERRVPQALSPSSVTAASALPPPKPASCGSASPGGGHVPRSRRGPSQRRARGARPLSRPGCGGRPAACGSSQVDGESGPAATRGTSAMSVQGERLKNRSADRETRPAAHRECGGVQNLAKTGRAKDSEGTVGSVGAFERLHRAQFVDRHRRGAGGAVDGRTPPHRCSCSPRVAARRAMRSTGVPVR